MSVRAVIRGVSPDNKYSISEVVRLGRGMRRVVSSNSNDHMTFIYDGKVWHYEETMHIVDPEFSKRLSKQYRRWQKHEADRERRGE